MRLFVGDPIWTPFNRPHDHLPARYGSAFPLCYVHLFLLVYRHMVTEYSRLFLSLNKGVISQEGICSKFLAEGSW